MIEPDVMFGARGAESSSDEAYESIRRAILEGTLRPGERIVEQRLAKLLNVSRTPVREALLKLERENLVARAGRGMAVRSFSAEEVHDIYDLRAHIESYAARRAAERITDAELAELRLLQDRLVEEAAKPSEPEVEWLRSLARLNQHFHTLIVRAARSAPLERIINGVGQTPLVYKSYLWYGEDEKRRSSEEHVKLLELLAARDAPGAEACWRAHIEFGRDHLVQRLTAQQARSDAGF
jgi:DNA-binding GntR family transcriptional regulator